MAFKKNKIQKKLLLAFTILFFTLSILDASRQWTAWKSARDMQTWKTVQGKVVASQKVGNKGDVPIVIYEYRLGEQIFTSSRLRAGATADADLTRYPKGSTVTVHINPGVVGDARVELPTGPGVLDYLRIAVYFAFGLLTTVVSAQMQKLDREKEQVEINSKTPAA